MKKTSNNKYEQLKRKIYLVMFPILLILNISYLLFSSYVDPYMKILMPFLCLVMAVTSIFFYFNRLFYTCEMMLLMSFGLYHLNRVYYIVVQLQEELINIYVMWSPFYFVFIFMVLEKKNALMYSLLIFFTSVGIGITHLDNLRVNDTFVQYILSSILCILILFFFQKIISTYIESDILKKNAYYDALTNIGNRRSIDECIENEIMRCNDSDNLFSIIYLDIDHYKNINDTYGHEIGDHVLREFTSLIKGYLQPSDFFGRWGGEEFIIISEKASLNYARDFAEKLREIVENHSFNYVDHITASFGIAVFQQNDTSKTLIKRADQALYNAKSSGRNTVRAN